MTDPDPDPGALAGLLEALDLTNTGASASEDIFIAPSQWTPGGRVFGGQVLAQSLIAAGRTVPDDRPVHSMHGYFLRPGDAKKEITFSVDRIHDGRSFTTRRTQASQDGKPILSMIASFQTEDQGLEHQAIMPAGLPDPETLPSTADVLAGIDHPVALFWSTRRAFDIRHVAYASDYSILESSLRAHGVSWGTPGLKAASLDHAMWWHRFGRVDEWMLYVQESPNAIGGRGLSLGRIYSRDGLLLASVAQEGTIRVPSAA